MSIFTDVVNLHKTFEIPLPERPTLLSAATAQFRLKLLQEELDEIAEAIDDESLIKLADGLADLVYVALGTAAMAGVPFDEVFQIVHEANLTKQRAPAEQTKRGYKYDLIKPAGFVSPEKAILDCIVSAYEGRLL